MGQFQPLGGTLWVGIGLAPATGDDRMARGKLSDGEAEGRLGCNISTDDNGCLGIYSFDVLPKLFNRSNSSDIYARNRLSWNDLDIFESNIDIMAEVIVVLYANERCEISARHMLVEEGITLCHEAAQRSHRGKAPP